MRPIRRTLKFTAAAIMAFAASACSGGGGGSSPGYTPPTPVVVTRSFPAGVAVAAGGGTAWDIVGVTTTLTGQFHSAGGNLYDTLRVDVTFAQSVANALPVPGQALNGLTQLGVAIALDTDGNPNTGYYQSCDHSNPQLPFEYVSDVGIVTSRLIDGNYSILGSDGPIYSGSPNPGAEAQTSVAGNVFSQTFLLGAVGVAAGSKVPKIGILVASANGAIVQAASGQTDCVPTSYTEIFTDGS
jgi:hypothetical protein